MDRTCTGTCLCGEITYVAVGAPVLVAQCHCDACRRGSGTGHTVGAMFASEAVSLNGRLREFRYPSDTGSVVTKAFCATCGSPIFGKNTRIPDHVTVSLGTMDDASGLDIEVVIFERDKATWDRRGEDVACFATQPDRTPES